MFNKVKKMINKENASTTAIGAGATAIGASSIGAATLTTSSLAVTSWMGIGASTFGGLIVGGPLGAIGGGVAAVLTGVGIVSSTPIWVPIVGAVGVATTVGGVAYTVYNRVRGDK